MTNDAVNYSERGPGLSFETVAQEETMGARIRRLREARGWSQAELARRMSVTRATVHQWEHDTSPNIRPANFLRLCEVLDTDPAYLLWGPSREDPEPPPGVAAVRGTRRFRD